MQVQIPDKWANPRKYKTIYYIRNCIQKEQNDIFEATMFSRELKIALKMQTRNI